MPKAQPKPAWNPPYTREVSPGRQARDARIDLRSLEKPHAVLDADDDAAKAALIRLGFVRDWRGQPCLRCADGVYVGQKSFRCNNLKCRDSVKIWQGSSFSNSQLSARQCYNLCVGYAAGLTVTMAVVDKGVSRPTASRHWKYFRCAEACAGLFLRAECKFEGTKECPAEVEADEAVLKKVKLYDENGQRTGTMHYRAFCLRQRGSTKTACYMMAPSIVPVACSGKPSPAAQVSAEELRPWLAAHLGNYVVLHTDGARAYASVIQAMCVEPERSHLAHDAVDHCAKQWTRFQKHGAWVKVICGTQLVENWWHLAKHHCIPSEAPADQAVLETYLLSLMYRQSRTGDPVWDLGSAVAKYQAHHAHDPCKRDVFFTNIADEDPYQEPQGDSSEGEDSGAEA